MFRLTSFQKYLFSKRSNIFTSECIYAILLEILQPILSKEAWSSISTAVSCNWPSFQYMLSVTKVKATQRNKQHVKGWKSGDLSFENQKIPSNSDLNTKQKDDPNSIIVFWKSFLNFNIICWISILEIYRFQNRMLKGKGSS